VNPALVQRQAGLAGVALLATIGALALGRGGSEATLGPTGPLAPEWQQARAGVFGPGLYGQETACGVELTAETVGVAHPVLPCGVDLVVGYAGRERRVEVIARGPAEGGRELDLSEALARQLGFEGDGRIRWRFAR
jgi:rare lipoprotein A (peptidoglycan hydrolase)